MRILLTNDDGYKAQGLATLVRMMKKYGEVTVVAPKYPQSGMSCSVPLGLKPIAAKDLGVRDGVRWAYLDATPSSCVKYALDELMLGNEPDIVISGINHGSNAATASSYSGTLGACMEAAIDFIPAVGVSLDFMHHTVDLSAVEKFFPEILEQIMALMDGSYGVYYNVNFPNLPADRIKGVKLCSQGRGHWVREFDPWDEGYAERHGYDLKKHGYEHPEVHAEEGEKLYVMAGVFEDAPVNPADADHHAMADGWITVSIHNVDSTDRAQLARSQALNRTF